MSVSIARYLKDFGDPQPSAPAFDDLDTPSFGDFADPFANISDPEPTIDLESEKQASFNEGQAATKLQLQSTFDTERAELIAAHAAELEAVRLRYTQELAGLVVARFREGNDALIQCLSEQTAFLLAPVLSEALAEKAVSGLADLVKTALAEAEAVKLVVNGPRVLFDHLSAALNLDESQIAYSETDDIDLSVTIGESVFVTRMSAWASSLRKVMK